jgi:hypothetical protein
MTEPRAVRLVPDEPLPPYAFVPGQAPHPFSDPTGHSHGCEEPSPPALDPERWPESRAYLYALDLFNAGFFWESHVYLEALWKAAGRKGPTADFLKGLIKLAAAGVKAREGRPAGVKSHAGRAAALWRQVARAVGAPQEPYLGFRLDGLIGLAETVCRDGWPATTPLLLPSGHARSNG